MGKLVISEFLTLDGVMEAPDQWQIKYGSEQMADDIQQELYAADTLLYGRTTYLTMAGAWPSRTGAIADRFNSLPKYVVSKTLQKAEWNKSSIISENAMSEIVKLKQGSGRILVWGSWQLVQALINQNLIDEYRLYIHPLTLGKGKRLFDETTKAQELIQTASNTFANGVSVHAYQKV